MASSSTRTRTVATARKGHPAAWRVMGPAGNAGMFEVESESTTLVTWRVMMDTSGNVECRGNSEGGRCWPFYQHATCKHCDAVQALVLHEISAVRAENSAAFERIARLTEKPKPKLRLEDLFD